MLRRAAPRAPPPEAGAVGTNTLRVAKNAKDFLTLREAGFPIEVVAGGEEARLIYLGVATAWRSPATGGGGRHRRRLDRILRRQRVQAAPVGKPVHG